MKYESILSDAERSRRLKQTKELVELQEFQHKHVAMMKKEGMI